MCVCACVCVGLVGLGACGGGGWCLRLWGLSPSLSFPLSANYFSKGRALISLMGPAIFGCRVWVHAPIQRVSRLMERHTDRSVTTGPRWAKASRPPVVDLTHQKCVCVCVRVCACGLEKSACVCVCACVYVWTEEVRVHVCM